MLCRPDLAVDVVVGGSASNAEQVRTRISDWPQARFFRQVDTMAELMAAADLAIGAGGSTSWERCCLGLPSITVCVADNQRAVVERLGDVGASVNLGDAANVSAADLAAAIRTLLAAPGLCRSLSERSGEMCDGRGAARVARSLRLDAGGLDAEVRIHPHGARRIGEDQIIERVTVGIGGKRFRG